ncbi:MAG: tetratricopeptide repeat protein [Prevotella sp.]|nr:tetratricopeptide repeat protein [Prevotella sp.]
MTNLYCLLLAGVATLLSQFDSKQDVATANQFFQQLAQEEFTDGRIQFKKDTPQDSLRQQVWYWAAEWLYDQQQYEQAAAYGKKALPLFRYDNDDKAGCLNILGCIYVRMGDVQHAAEYAKQCLAIDMKSGDDDRISSSMNTVAGIYMAGYQAKEAEQYVLGALEHAEKVDNPARKAVILGMASEVYHSLRNDQKALPYVEQAYQIDSLLGRQPQMTIRKSQKASVLLGLHRYQEAESLLRQVIPVFKEAGDYHSYAIALNRLGMSLFSQDRQREAIPYYKIAAGLFSKMGDVYNEMHSHRGLYECYWKINPDSAKIELDYFDLLKDSLYEHATAQSLSRYNAEFGNDQLQQENEEVRSAHQRTIIFGIILLLLIVGAAYLVIRYIRKQEKERIESLMREISLLRGEKESGDGSADPSPQGFDQQSPQEEESQVPNEDRLFLMRVVEVVNEGFATKNLGVEHIASEMNMSVQTFRRRLQSAAGETPKAFVSAIQMEKAGKLLREHADMPIVDVAYQCGFEEASSFTHTFKRIFGMSPSQYREQSS